MSDFTEAAFLTRLGQFDSTLRDDVHVTSDHQLLTTDTLVEGTHFDWRYTQPDDLGWKAVAVNASDIAATGGVLDGVLVALTLPAGVQTDTVDQFYNGVHACLATLPGNPTILGGDTTRGPCWMVTITAVGHMPAGYLPGRRWQAQPGDRVLTTGPHGLSANGLYALANQIPGLTACKQAHLRPQPRLRQGLQLAKAGCRYALMDSSDGLADAMLKLAQASHVSIELWLNALPAHDELNQLTLQISTDLMLYGGEDFELVACWPTDTAVPEGFTVVGQVLAEQPGQAWVITELNASRQYLTSGRTFQHFEAVRAE